MVMWVRIHKKMPLMAFWNRRPIAPNGEVGLYLLRSP
jgi:hypothetical protein